MAKRQKAHKLDPRLFAATVKPRLSKLAQNVVTATVSLPFEPNELPEVLWPEDVVTKLRAAWPLIRPFDQSDHYEYLSLGRFGLRGETGLFLAIKELKMLSPNAGLMVDPLPSEIFHAVRAAYAVAADFGEVMHAVTKMEEQMEKHLLTLGEIKFYMPWLTQFLPLDHPIHTAKAKAADCGYPPELSAPLRKAPDTLLAASLAPNDLAERRIMSLGMVTDGQANTVLDTALFIA